MTDYATTWHTRPLYLTCVTSGCLKSATVEVFDNRNGSYGRHCRLHGETLAKSLTRESAARFSARSSEG